MCLSLMAGVQTADRLKKSAGHYDPVSKKPPLSVTKKGSHGAMWFILSLPIGETRMSLGRPC